MDIMPAAMYGAEHLEICAKHIDALRRQAAASGSVRPLGVPATAGLLAHSIGNDPGYKARSMPIVRWARELWMLTGDKTQKHETTCPGWSCMMQPNSSCRRIGRPDIPRGSMGIPMGSMDIPMESIWKPMEHSTLLPKDSPSALQGGYMGKHPHLPRYSGIWGCIPTYQLHGSMGMYSHIHISKYLVIWGTCSAEVQDDSDDWAAAWVSPRTLATAA
jgi:hypothetical protein